MKTTIQGVLIRLTDEERQAVEDTIRRFESATRYAYARLCDSVPVLEIEKDVAERFSLNSRWAKDAVARARAAYAGAEKLVEEGKTGSFEVGNFDAWTLKVNNHHQRRWLEMKHL